MISPCAPVIKLAKELKWIRLSAQFAYHHALIPPRTHQAWQGGTVAVFILPAVRPWNISTLQAYVIPLMLVVDVQ